METIIIVVLCTVLGMIMAGTAGYYICQSRKATAKGTRVLPVLLFVLSVFL